jgi:hypothetical protein
MSLRVRVGNIAPDLRFAVTGALADPGACVVVGGLPVRAESCLPRSLAIPLYLRYGDRDAVIVAEGTEAIGELERRLAPQILTAAERDVVDDLSAAVIVLDAVDRVFRESGLWRGNIYLAGTGALPAVLGLADTTGLSILEPETVVRELAALELAYLFPVAGKFRSGEYDGQVQYRLNGWGRGLARRLITGQRGAARAAACHRALSQHLARQRQRYASYLAGLDLARQKYEGSQLDHALALPIPVLV